MKIGEIMPLDREIILNEGRKTVCIDVANTGDRPIQVGSHFHFFEVNKLLSFDREKAYGMRLDIPSGTSVRFEPGEQKSVQLVEIVGNRAEQIFVLLVQNAQKCQMVYQDAYHKPFLCQS